jgi:hypothetical protein
MQGRLSPLSEGGIHASGVPVLLMLCGFCHAGRALFGIGASAV